jgi:hypothetical protein
MCCRDGGYGEEVEEVDRIDVVSWIEEFVVLARFSPNPPCQRRRK